MRGQTRGARWLLSRAAKPEARRDRDEGEGALTHADSTGLEALDELTKDLERDEITLVVARLRTHMEEQFALAGLTELIGPEHFYPTVHGAVQAS
jgi:MFS superfamily sulfate permease-like transporter